MESNEKIVKKRGRPATGRKRDKQISIRLTSDEIEQVKKYQKEKNVTITEILMNEVKKKFF